MIAFYLVRHGQKKHASYDPPLTDLGLEQAEKTAAALQSITFREIVASPKLRTKQTAEIIAKRHLMPTRTEDRIVERIEWQENQPLEEFLTDWDKTDIDRGYVPKNGFSSKENGSRAKGVLEELSDRHKEGNILIVTHGGTIGDLVRELFAYDTISHIVDCDSGASYIDILECSVTVIRKHGKRYTLEKLGDTAHLLRTVK